MDLFCSSKQHLVCKCTYLFSGYVAYAVKARPPKLSVWRSPLEWDVYVFLCLEVEEVDFRAHIGVYTGCPKKIMSRVCGYCGGAVDSIFSCLHSCTGQASTYSLRPCLSQSDSWLLIYGRKKAKLVVASKTALLCYSPPVSGVTQFRAP